MSQVLHLSAAERRRGEASSFLPPLYGSVEALTGSTSRRWAALREEANLGGSSLLFHCYDREKISWLQEQARKALESALGGNKSELENWSIEFEKRQEKEGGSMSGSGGWFGGGGWFGWFGGNNL